MALCMNDHLNYLCGWITQNMMQLNCSKSSVMSICTDVLPTIPVNSTVLKVVSHQKYITRYSFYDYCSGPHIDKVYKSMSYYLYTIGSHHASLTKSVSKMLVESLVLSRMRYTISTWEPALQQKHISRLQWMQNRGIWLSCNLKYDHVSSYVSFGPHKVVSAGPDRTIDTFLYVSSVPLSDLS